LKNAQHIVGSCQVIIYIKEKTGHIKKIGFSGDLGNTLFDNPFVKQFEPITKCNCFIGESTYSNPIRSSKKKDRDKDIEKIKTIISDYCIDKKSRVIFPVFAMQRLQTILKILYDIWGQDKSFTIPIYIDTPLGIKITNLFKDVLVGEQKELVEKILLWENIRMINDVEESKLCVINHEPKIVLSSSGMITAGRSVNYVKEYLPNPNDCIVTCGFMAEGSIGWQIRNSGNKANIKIDGKLYKNKCQIFNLLSFSSHMQFEQLVNYYKSINTEYVFLVHGNSSEKLILKEELEKEFARLNKSTKVVAVKQDDIFYI
jgi:metallo-beta-lactamase family protein